MLLRELKISRKNDLIKVIDVYHLMLYPYSPKCHYKKNQHYIKKILCRKNNKRYYQEKHYEKTYERHL